MILAARSHSINTASAMFRACKYEIKDTDDVLPGRPSLPVSVNYFFEICPLQAFHA